MRHHVNLRSRSVRNMKNACSSARHNASTCFRTQQKWFSYLSCAVMWQISSICAHLWSKSGCYYNLLYCFCYHDSTGVTQAIYLITRRRVAGACCLRCLLLSSPPCAGIGMLLFRGHDNLWWTPPRNRSTTPVKSTDHAARRSTAQAGVPATEGVGLTSCWSFMHTFHRPLATTARDTKGLGAERDTC